MEPALSTPEAFGLQDRSWTTTQWRTLLETLIDSNLFTWKDVTTLVLGQLNPPQVGTSIASNAGFQKNLRGQGDLSVMQQVYDWIYGQLGRCADCGSRLDLQADHVNPRETAGLDKTSVDRLDNLTLRCRRDNVIRRISHKLGGKTHLTAEAALMWILLVIRPRTYIDFLRLCRLYGMSMADVRMKEAWAMAVWLNRDDELGYEIDGGTGEYLVLRWPDNALTRQRTTDKAVPDETEVLGKVPGTDVVSFLSCYSSKGRSVTEIHRIPVTDLPFSTYDLGDRPAQSLAILAYQPKANDLGELIKLPLLPPRERELLEWKIHPPDELYGATIKKENGRLAQSAPPSPKKISKKVPCGDGDSVSLTQQVMEL